MTSFPLREKRKAESRERLIAAARDLFWQNGYDDTTLEQVADRAGLHVQTLYRHFATKQDLATAADQELLDRFRREIRDPERVGSTFDFWRVWLRTVLRAAIADGGDRYRRHLRHRWTQPTVSSRLVLIGHDYEDLLTESLAADLGGPDPSDAVLDSARLAAITLWGAHAHVTRRYASTPGFDLEAEALAAVDSVESLFAQ